MPLDCMPNGISLPPVMHVMASVELKQEASKASLQATVVGHILTAKNLYDWGAGHLLNMKLFFISKEEVSAHVDQQENRFSNAKTVPGTRSYHCCSRPYKKHWWCEGCQEMNLYLRQRFSQLQMKKIQLLDAHQLVMDSQL